MPIFHHGGAVTLHCLLWYQVTHLSHYLQSENAGRVEIQHYKQKLSALLQHKTVTSGFLWNIKRGHPESEVLPLAHSSVGTSQHTNCRFSSAEKPSKGKFFLGCSTCLWSALGWLGMHFWASNTPLSMLRVRSTITKHPSPKKIFHLTLTLKDFQSTGTYILNRNTSISSKAGIPPHISLLLGQCPHTKQQSPGALESRPPAFSISPSYRYLGLYALHLETMSGNFGSGWVRTARCWPFLPYSQGQGHWRPAVRPTGGTCPGKSIRCGCMVMKYYFSQQRERSVLQTRTVREAQRKTSETLIRAIGAEIKVLPRFGLGMLCYSITGHRPAGKPSGDLWYVGEYPPSEICSINSGLCLGFYRCPPAKYLR